MVLPSSSYIVGPEELSELKQIVKTQLDSVNSQIDDLSSEVYGPQRLIPLILAILSFASIILVNWDLVLQFWVPSLFLLIFVLFFLNIIDATRMTKAAIKPFGFKNVKEFKIAYLLALKQILKNFKTNDIAFFLILLIGWIIMIYNFFEFQIQTDLTFFVIYTAILLFSLIVIFFNYLLYDLFVGILAEIGQELYEGITQDGFIFGIKKIKFFRIWKHLTKFQLLYTTVYLCTPIMILLLFCLIFSNFFATINWEYMKNVIHLTIFQFFLLVTLIIFISFRTARETYEQQKVILTRISAALEQSKQAIDMQLFSNAKTSYKISKLFYGKKVNFSLFFTKWVIEVNGEWNIEENYDWLYNLLKIPEETIQD